MGARPGIEVYPGHPWYQDDGGEWDDEDEEEEWDEDDDEDDELPGERDRFLVEATAWAGAHGRPHTQIVGHGWTGEDWPERNLLAVSLRDLDVRHAPGGPQRWEITVYVKRELDGRYTSTGQFWTNQEDQEDAGLAPVPAGDTDRRSTSGDGEQEEDQPTLWETEQTVS